MTVVLVDLARVTMQQPTSYFGHYLNPLITIKPPFITEFLVSINKK